ncbi:VirD4-like conjugal transfer protein, CD1115 family [[Ruminococcus] lactaris]|uniref:VirD4-like conjugal transfer protein, CD1115 family n=1 Tax=[Ruminococcus] lactaris TaxID=46228 RepID=UPI003A7F5466
MSTKKQDWVLYLVFLPFVWWAAAITACAIAPDKNFIQILETLSEKLEQPFFITYTPYTFKCILIFTAAYFLGIGIYESQKRNYRRGVEHGSAKWGNVSEICRRYCEKQYTQNLLLTQHFRMGLDGYKHKRNLNVLVVGGSGAGKSRTYAIPNIMQCNCSMVITDPKAELLRKTGGVLERNGYEVRVFDLINPETSWCYNPFAYVRDDKDVLKLINNLIRNTTPKGAQSSDPFWEKSETALLQALMLYLLHEAPPEEQNFPMIMEMLGSAQVKEDDEDYQSPLDILFERLEMRNPESIAVKQYAIYKQAAGKTAKSILISVGVRLAAFNLKQIANLTCTDELDLYSIGEKKVALFCCIPDADTSMNYLVGMIYSNLFQTLYYVADRKYGGRLPIPVHCIMDEWPNVALPDDFDKILATMRSRGISCSIIIQNIAQMKALFKDSYESLIGNCDEFLYLGGNEKEGHKYVSELLGKETLDTNTYGQTKGRSGSYSVNYQQTGRELLTPDEIRLLDNRKAILFIRGERPIMDDKYDFKKHVNFRYTEDGGASPYDYAKTPLAHDDLKIDINRLDDYELLSTEDILGE